MGSIFDEYLWAVADESYKARYEMQEDLEDEDYEEEEYED